MTLNLETVQAAFAEFSGEDLADGSPRAALCLRLCRESAARGEALAAGREEQAEACLAALESWAAARAYYHLTLADEAAGPESVTADGVTVKAGERSAKARALMTELRRAAAAALGEEGFYFGQV